MDTFDFDKIRYIPSRFVSSKTTKRLEVIGLDTESYTSGKPFLFCTSEGDSFTYAQVPKFFLSAKYRGKTFVVWNLLYDAGAILYHLPTEQLTQLAKHGKTSFNGFHYYYIPHKELRIGRGKNAIRIYDIAPFYASSLNAAATKYLNESKLPMETNRFEYEYVRLHFKQIKDYCIQDAKLTQKLADKLITLFNSWGLYPQRLYSTAYVSYRHFSQVCYYPTVIKFWNKTPELLRFACEAYVGGKFECYQKGVGYFYEYDINSAYPYEIANLLDLRYASAYKSTKLESDMDYAFLRCNIECLHDIKHPIAVKEGVVNTFPVGTFARTITKEEYEYLQSFPNIKVRVKEVWGLRFYKRSYPFRKEIERLYQLKEQFRDESKSLEFLTTKILLNSLYGKFLQLVKKGDNLVANRCWNPIYGAIITANVRLRVSQVVQEYPAVIAVHTDSIISLKALNFDHSRELGEWRLEKEGKGVILGTGIYQIGDKVKFRGFDSKVDFFTLLNTDQQIIPIEYIHPYTWKQAIAFGWGHEAINFFTPIDKQLNINFDHKRIWERQWNSGKDVLNSWLVSIPKIRLLRCRG